MKVVRNGQQVEFSRNAEGDLVQTSTFRNQASMVMPVKNFLLPLPEGDDDKIIVVASNLGLARQIVLRFVAEQAAAKAERAAAAAEAKALVARVSDETLDLLREQAHGDRRNLVNLYVGADRAERIARIDRIIGAIEEEQAERAGLPSSDEILAAFAVI